MKQTFKAKSGYIWNIGCFLLIIGTLGYFVINSGQPLDWANPLLPLGILVVFNKKAFTK